MNVIYSFIITFLAGLSTLIGSLFIFLKTNNKNKVIVSSLSLSSSVMLFISIFELIPESIKYLTNRFNILISILLFLIFFIIGNIIPYIIKKQIPSDNNLYKIGIISMVTIILHNVPEGILTFITSSYNIKLGISMALMIAMHNVPEGISIAIPIYYSTNNKFKAIFYSFISALSEPFGALIAFLFFKGLITNIFIGIILSFVSGIMINISIFELLKETKSYNLNKYVRFFYILGLIITLINLYFI